MKTIIITLIFLLSSLLLLGQVTNGDRYNIFVQTVGYDFDPDSQNGTNRIVFLLKGEAGTSSSSCLFDRSINGGEAGGGHATSRLFNRDT